MWKITWYFRSLSQLAVTLLLQFKQFCLDIAWLCPKPCRILAQSHYPATMAAANQPVVHLWDYRVSCTDAMLQIRVFLWHIVYPDLIASLLIILLIGLGRWGLIYAISVGLRRFSCHCLGVNSKAILKIVWQQTYVFPTRWHNITLLIILEYVKGKKLFLSHYPSHVVQQIPSWFAYLPCYTE